MPIGSNSLLGIALSCQRHFLPQSAERLCTISTAIFFYRLQTRVHQGKINLSLVREGQSGLELSCVYSFCHLSDSIFRDRDHGEWSGVSQCVPRDDFAQDPNLCQKLCSVLSLSQKTVKAFWVRSLVRGPVFNDCSFMWHRRIPIC